MADVFSAENLEKDHQGRSEQELAGQLQTETNAYAVYFALKNTFDSAPVYVRCNTEEEAREFRHNPAFKRTRLLTSRARASEEERPRAPDAASGPPPAPAGRKNVFPGVSQEDLIQALVVILRADGRIGMRERRFLGNVCKRFEIADHVLRASLLHAERGAAEIRLPNDPKGRSSLLTALIAAAGVDDNIASGEWKMLEALAGKMGIARSGLHASIQEFLKRRAP